MVNMKLRPTNGTQTSPNDPVRDVTLIILVGGIKVGKETAPEIAAPCSYAALFPIQGIDVSIWCSDRLAMAIMCKYPNTSNNFRQAFITWPILQHCIVDRTFVFYQGLLTHAPAFGTWSAGASNISEDVKAAAGCLKNVGAALWPTRECRSQRLCSLEGG